MKTSLIAVLIFISTSVFSQKKNETALYTFCGKPCTGTIVFTVEELEKCDKLFLPINSGDRIGSFVGSLIVNGASVDLTVQGNHKDFIRTIGSMKSGSKLLISKMKLLHENKTIAAPSVVIEIK